jgi:hypothetical protein
MREDGFRGHPRETQRQRQGPDHRLPKHVVETGEGVTVEAKKARLKRIKEARRKCRRAHALLIDDVWNGMPVEERNFTNAQTR